MSTTSPRAWFRPQQVKAIVAQVESEFGVSLAYMVPRIKRALIAEAILGTLRMQDKEALTIEQIDWLYDACMVEAGRRISAFQP